MPTSNPRLMIVVTPEQRELLAELGKLQGRSSASLVRDLVDAATPMFQGLLPVLRAAAAAKQGQPAQLEEVVSQALQATYGDDPAQLDLMQHINAIAAYLESAEDDDARPDRSASEDRTDGGEPPPPACNYGGQGNDR